MIIASNELDEDLIADLKRQGAKINAWGVGTNLITCKGAPALSGVYKLVAIHDGGRWQPRIKRSSNPAKTTDPGVKKVVRFFGDQDTPLGDILYLEDEQIPETKEVAGQHREQGHFRYRLKVVASRAELSRLCIKEGKRIVPPESIETIRTRAKTQIDSLPEELKRLRNPEIYPVALSSNLAQLKEEMLVENSAF
jgi:nicotinate phosphoribosyltransferase